MPDAVTPPETGAPPVDPRTAAGLSELEWYRQVYRGDQPQLTTRAVVTGLLLGFMFSFANVYIGLKTGWFFSMALAASLASFATWRILDGLRIARSPLTLLETNCMQSTASSAAYATGNMVVGVFPAMLLLSVSPAHPVGVQRHWVAVAAWIACIAALGVTLAIPLKRQLINRERLAFPSGTAAAVMLHGLHHAGSGVRSKTRWLLGAIGVSALIPLLRDIRGFGVISPSSKLFDWLPRLAAAGSTYKMSEAGLVLDHSVLLVAAGVFVGLRIAIWMVVGGLVTTFVIGPLALASMWTDTLGHSVAAATRPDTAWLDVGIWIGAPLLVTHAMIALAEHWRSFLRTFTSRRQAAQRPERAKSDLEIPMAWFWFGFAICGATTIALARLLFEIPVLLGVIAVMMSLVFSTVACRITGETDVTPGGPMGKLTQLTFGMLRPQHPSTNLMTASMTHASSVASADLLNDLKSGYLLGANPRRQLVAQALGIVAGTAASVIAFFVLIPDATALLGERGHAPVFAAPAAHQFKAIAELLQFGLGALHPMHRKLVIVGVIAGVIVSSLERLTPKSLARWLPSAAGLGLGLLLPLSSSLSMVLGAGLAAFAARLDSSASERLVWPISAGALAGESLAGVVVALVNNFTG